MAQKYGMIQHHECQLCEGFYPPVRTTFDEAKPIPCQQITAVWVPNSIIASINSLFPRIAAA